MKEKVAVLGAGTMGSGIAQVLAVAGYQVFLRDLEKELVEKGINNIKENLQKAVDRGKMSNDLKEETFSRVKGTTDIALIKDVDLVIEAVTEKMEIKKEVFRELDRICSPETILATNTSALSITELAAVTGRPGKVVGVHFFNPAHIMKLVELIRGMTTLEDTFVMVKELVENAGKELVEVNESPGFIVNRLLIPLINEAAFILYEGTADAEDIDRAMKLGANHPLGPLALADLVGLDVCLAIMKTLYQEFSDSKYRPCPLLKQKVRAGQLGRKTGRGFYKY